VDCPTKSQMKDDDGYLSSAGKLFFVVDFVCSRLALSHDSRVD